MRIHYFQHEASEGPGCIEQWAVARGHQLTATRYYLDEPEPPLGGIDWLVVMGGSMNIYQEKEFPWLAREKRFIKQAIDNGKVVFGICLGAQLIADVLGGPVTRNAQSEIGWFPVEMTEAAKGSALFGFLPERLTVFHWHGDTFALPPRSVHLARSEGCENQAFIYDGRVIGLQFHLEFTREYIEAVPLDADCGSARGKYIQTPAEMRRGYEAFAGMHEAMFGLLDRLAAATA